MATVHRLVCRVRSIDPEEIDQMLRERGFDSRSEYIRSLIIRDAEENDYDITRN